MISSQKPLLKNLTMDYLAALLVTAIATLLNLSFLSRMDHANLIMVYLAGIVYVASKSGRGASIFASFLSVAAFDFFFVPPQLTLAIADTQLIITFTIMLSIALIISALTAQVQEKALLAKEKERRTAALLAMSRDLAVTREQKKLIAVSLRHIRTFYEVRAGIYLPDSHNHLSQFTVDEESPTAQADEDACARWAFDNGRSTGLGLGPFSQTTSLYMPLLASKGVVGVLQISPRQAAFPLNREEIEMLEIFANQTALCIETTNLTEATQQANIRVEKEQLRNTFLNSISHDLRTPLATITGASSTLIEEDENLDSAKQKELAQVIFEESLVAKELAHRGLTELHVVKTMHERKAMMAERAEGFVALPGGYGTLDEFCEIITWSQLGFHKKPCAILNIDGYFDELIKFFDTAAKSKFISEQHRDMIIISKDPAEVLEKMATYHHTAQEKWIGKADL
jgi:uncharacterized protein (TIGR00730 family)